MPNCRLMGDQNCRVGCSNNLVQQLCFLFQFTKNGKRAKVVIKRNWMKL